MTEEKITYRNSLRRITEGMRQDSVDVTRLLDGDVREQLARILALTNTEGSRGIGRAYDQLDAAHAATLGLARLLGIEVS